MRGASLQKRAVQGVDEAMERRPMTQERRGADTRRSRAHGLPDIVRVPGGWTADAIGARARKTGFDVAAKQAS
jgi:hypothetical protein